MTKNENIKSDVNIYPYPVGNGYIIEVKDQYTENKLAVTREELERICLYGEAILKHNNK